MPGTNLVGAKADSLPVDRAIEAVSFFESYSERELAAVDDRRLLATGYDAYPITTVETEDATVVLEGYLYDVDDVTDHLESVGDWLLSDHRDRLTEWLLARDGDFVVTAVDTDSGRVVFANDPFARLPVYHATVDGAPIVSREIAFVRTLAALHTADGDLSGERLDRLGVAQSLLFGYPLGARTVFEGVERVPPGSIVTVTDDVDVARYHRQDFGTPAHGGRDRQTNAARLATLFRDACKRRVDAAGGAVLALSGGLDSRAVAAGVGDLGTPIDAVTFQGPPVDDEEVTVASEIAEAVDVPWRAYEVGHRDRGQTLLDIKQGTNYRYVDHLVEFFEHVRDDYGAPTVLTGDGGDKALPALTPPLESPTDDELLDYLVDENCRFSLETAAALADVGPTALRESVRERLAGYPETDPAAQYVHFLVRERGINWLNNGEDRNRYFCWSTTPFYSVPFFRYAMNCPAEQKAGNRLYKSFLTALDPRMLDITYVDFGAPPSSLEYRLKQRSYRLLGRYPGLKRTVLGRLRNDGPDTASAEALTEQVAEADFFDWRARAILDRTLAADGHPEATLSTLWSLAAIDARELPVSTSVTEETTGRPPDGSAGRPDGDPASGETRGEAAPDQ